MSIQLDLAESFLRRFNYETTTIQVFPTLINGKAKWPRRGGRILATGEEGSTAIAFSGRLKTQKFIGDLVSLQKQRMGVYFMVNEGDGERHGKKIVRNSLAVTTLKACFVDTDEGDRKRLDKFCRENKIKPHAIIQSSPGKYHYYFFIRSVGAASDSTFLWQSIQHRFAAIDPHFDDSMADLGQVLRLPGFYHTKGKPYLIRPVYESTHSPYKLDQLFDIIGADATPPRSGRVFERPTQAVAPGRRHDVLSAYLGSLSNSVRDAESLIDAGIGFAARHFNNSNEWKPGGSRFHELQDQCNYVINEREKEERQVSLSALDSDTIATEKGFVKLPDDFYKTAPGVVGKMVREICHYSTQPYPAFAFAASCALVGSLKAPFVRSSIRDNPPATYFLCLAESGRGKDFPRAVVGRAFIRLGLSGMFTQKFRSAQGFLRKLARGDGNQLVLHDEAHHLFAQIRRADTDYITGLKPHLLSLFSSCNEPIYDVGAVVTDKIDIPPIPYPTVNYCGFGVPSGFEETFKSEELDEGFLMRFLIVRDFHPVIPLSKGRSHIPKEFKFEKLIRRLSQKLRAHHEAKILDDDKSTTLRKFTTIPFTEEAEKLFNAYDQRIADSRNSSTKILDVLQSRLAEHVLRLSVLLSDDVTTADIVNFAIKFVDHCYTNVASHVDSFNQGQANRDIEDLIKFISTRQRTVKGPMMSEDFRTFRIRDRHSLENTLHLAIKLNLVQEHQNYRRPGVTRGRTATAYSVLCSSEKDL